MLDPDLLLVALTSALRYGGGFGEVFAEQTLSTSILVEEDRVERVLTGVDAGVGIRVIHDGRIAYAATNDLSKAAVLESARTVSRAVSLDEQDLTLDLTRPQTNVELPVHRHPRAVETSEKVRLVLRANHAARAYDRRVRQVRVHYYDLLQHVMVVSSDGTLVEDERVHVLMGVTVVAAEGSLLYTGYESVGGHLGFELFDEVPIETVAETAARRAIQQLTASPAPAGRMPVVLSSAAGGTLVHEAVGHGLEADLVQQGVSVYAGKRGQRVAAPTVTVIDDATLPGKRGSYRWDDEGIEAQRTVLIERGVLKTYLYDRFTSMKDRTRSTGNGRRESYRHKPIPRMTNTLIAQGDEDPQAVIRAVTTGLLVTKMGGGQVNTVNGDFVFEVSEGYRIEHGGIGAPVRGATLIGNGPEVLRQIALIGRDLGFGIGTCGKDGQGVPVSDAQPTLLVESLIVGGLV